MKQLAIWFFGLIECLILLMMKFIKVLEGEICADSAAKSGELIKIPGDISVIKGTSPVNPGPAGNFQFCEHTNSRNWGKPTNFKGRISALVDVIWNSVLINEILKLWIKDLSSTCWVTKSSFPTNAATTAAVSDPETNPIY